MHPTRAKLRKLGLDSNGDCSFCNKTEENIDYIFRDHDLAISIWFTINDNCPNSVNTNLRFVYWREHLWNNKLWYKKIYGNVLQQVITILWVIWTCRNNIIFKELTKKIIYKHKHYK